MNVKFVISYDGTKFLGSQKQPNKKSVEDKILNAFKRINIDTKIILSGRTDKDVHATGQVFNAYIPSFWQNRLDKLKKVLNDQLPFSIKVLYTKEVSDDFHARFHARKRVYRYIVTNKELTPFNYKYLSYEKKINECLLKEAIKEFVGIFDFEFFHKQGSDKENMVREIYEASFYKYKDMYIFKFVGNSYLRSQIRLMVGFLLEISKNKLTIEDLRQQLRKEKKVFSKPSCPFGLYLSKVFY